MSVWLPWLSETHGEPVLEIGRGLALERRVSSSHRATVSSPGEKIEMVAIASPEFKRVTVKGKTVREVEGLKTT
jgi:hypothetical protein